MIVRNISTEKIFLAGPDVRVLPGQEREIADSWRQNNNISNLINIGKLLIIGFSDKPESTVLEEEIAISGGLAQVFNDFPPEAKDGINDTYSTQFAYKAGTLRVYINGKKAALGGEFIEVDSTHFQMVTPPLPPDSIEANYERV
jgi:hypothetical protein